MRGAGRLCLVALGFLALLPTFGLAQEATTGPADAPSATTALQSPILTLDRDRLFSETLFGKTVNGRFKIESDTLIAENLRLEKALETEERDLTDRRASLPATEFQSLAAAFDAKAEQIRTAQEAKSRAIAAARDAEQQRFLEAAIPVLGDLMRETGAVAIFDKNMIILSLRGIDITDSAIARIDAVLGNGTAPAAGPSSGPDPAAEPKPQP